MSTDDNTQKKSPSHPLESLDDDDEDFYKVSQGLSKTITTSEPSKPSVNTPLSTSSSSPISLIKARKEPKRMAPKIPSEMTMDRGIAKKTSASLNSITSKDLSMDSNFYIDVSYVRWFYKEEVTSKKSSSVSPPSEASNEALYVTSANGTNQMVYESELPTAADYTPVPASNYPKKWQAFNKYDSASLEAEYRDLISRKLDSPKLVQVLNNLYEVDLLKRKCTSIYWENDCNMIVMRAIWFQDNYEPFDEKSNIEIERKHVELFREALEKTASDTDNLPAAQQEQENESATSPTRASKREQLESQTEPIGSLTIESGVITWYSIDNILFEKSKQTIFSTFSKMVSRSKLNGVKIQRGYKEKAEKEKEKSKDKLSEIKVDEKPGEITHVVFVIHGIAQKLFQNNIVKKCDEIRTLCDKMKAEFMKDPQHKDKRYAFLPVDWRTSLTLDDGIVDSITLKTVASIRNTLNSSALDIMYYTSPLFRTEIMNSLSSEINRLYDLFCQKNPYFKTKYNKVSFIAHSLGSVIIYDILTSNNSLTQFTNLYGEDLTKEENMFQRFSHNDSELFQSYLDHKNKIQLIEKELVKSNANITPLNFISENLFCLGSPLPVFLALRGVRPSGTGKQDHVLPKHLCKRLYNIFHPSDPVAYRIEPLILKHYSTLSPIEICKPKMGEDGTSYKELNEKRKPLDYDLQSTISTKSSISKKQTEKDAKSAELETTSSTNSFSANLIAQPNQIDQVELEFGLDFKLQNSFTLEKFSNTLALSIVAFQAHTCYWNSEDTALFITSQLCANDSKS